MEMRLDKQQAHGQGYVWFTERDVLGLSSKIVVKNFIRQFLSLPYMESVFKFVVTPAKCNRGLAKTRLQLRGGFCISGFCLF